MNNLIFVKTFIEDKINLGERCHVPGAAGIGEGPKESMLGAVVKARVQKESRRCQWDICWFCEEGIWRNKRIRMADNLGE